MGQDGSTRSDENQIDHVEEADLYALSTDGEFIPIELTEDGNLRAAITSDDGSRLTDALASVGIDSLLVDSNNALDVSAAEVDVDVATQSLAQVATNLEQIGGQAQSAVDVADKIDQIEDALASVGTDSLLVDSNDPLDVSAAEVDVDVATQSLAQVATNLEQIGGQTQSAVDVASRIDSLFGALASEGTDSLLVDSNQPLLVDSNNPLDVSAAEVAVDIATQSVNPLTVTDDGNLAIAAYNGGTVPTEQQSAVAVEDSTGTTIDPATTALEGALKSNDTDEFVSRTADSTGEEQDLKQTASAYENGTVLAAGGEVVNLLVAPGGQEINGRVVSSGTYDVEARYQDDAGNTIFTETIASGVTGGTTTNLGPSNMAVTPDSDHIAIAVVDTSAAEQTVDAVLHYN